jgi:hypothetical protein
MASEPGPQRRAHAAARALLKVDEGGIIDGLDFRTVALEVIPAGHAGRGELCELRKGLFCTLSSGSGGQPKVRGAQAQSGATLQWARASRIVARLLAILWKVS